MDGREVSGRFRRKQKRNVRRKRQALEVTFRPSLISSLGTKIYYSSKFAKEYKRLSTKAKLAAEKKEIIFRKNPFDPRLKTHKLAGKLKSYYSFSIDYQIRIIFEFAGKDTVWFLSVGTHEIYK